MEERRMTLPRLLNTIFVTLIVTTTATSAHAVLDLTGVTVQGELFINGDLTKNYFDPVNLKVPAGFGNSPSPGGTGEAEASVSDTIVEFGYQGAAASFQVNFHNNGVVDVSGSANPFTSVAMNFLSPAFTPSVTLTPVTSNPTIVATYSNNTLGYTLTSMTTISFSSTQFLNIQGTPPPQIPEPASLTLVGLGLVGVIARYRKRT
jgi:hypothetical protein